MIKTTKTTKTTKIIIILSFFILLLFLFLFQSFFIKKKEGFNKSITYDSNNYDLTYHEEIFTNEPEKNKLIGGEKIYSTEPKIYVPNYENSVYLSNNATIINATINPTTNPTK
jgi:hypothetical protein